MGKSVDQMS